MSEIRFNTEALLGKLEQLNEVALDKAINRACIIVENAARQNAPAETGELRRSIMHEVEG